MKIRTLKDLAAAINAMGNGHTAIVNKSWTSTDTKIAGTRLRRPGRGRKGLKLEVKGPTGEVVLRADTSYGTSLYDAASDAVRLFGKKLDLDPGELFAVGDYVRILDFGPLYGDVVAVKMQNKTRAKHYQVKLRNDHITTVEPWRVRHYR